MPTTVQEANILHEMISYTVYTPLFFPQCQRERQEKANSYTAESVSSQSKQFPGVSCSALMRVHVNVDVVKDFYHVAFFFFFFLTQVMAWILVKGYMYTGYIHVF